MFKQNYVDQVRLLVNVLPHITDEKCFALKGGTAINLFVRDMPRLSVDIDLFYLPIEPREESLKNIVAALNRIAERVKKALPKVKISVPQLDEEIRFDVTHERSTIKVEVSPVTRGCLFNPEPRRTRPAVEQEFGFAEMPVVSFPDLYAGKLCAALDRQHPRDWFDVKLLLENEGIDRALVQALVVYVACSKEPMNEVLNPRWNDIRNTYEKHFVGMTRDVTPIEDLEKIREPMLDEIARHFTVEDGEFLLSLKRKEPNWALVGIEGIKDLPALKWKLLNINKMSDESREKATKKLEEAIELLHQRRKRMAAN